MTQEESQREGPGSLRASDDELALVDFLGVLQRGWKLIAIVAAACTAAAALAAFLMTPVYRAKVLLAPASEDESGALEKLSGAFGGLAELAGVSLSGSGSNKEEAIALLRSRILAEQFIAEQKLMPVLFADRWDARRSNWNVADPDDVPTPGEAFELWDEDIRTVESSATSTLVTLRIDWKDRRQAASWATELVRRVNGLMRTRAIHEAQKTIEFLRAELAKTDVVDLQLAINRIIETQIKNMTLAKVREEYYFRVVDPAVVPDADDFVAPKRSIMIVVGLVGGLLVGFMIVIIRNALRLGHDVRPR